MLKKIFNPVEILVLLFLLLTTAAYLVLGQSDRNAISFYLQQVITVLYIYPLALLIMFVVVFSKTGYQRKKAGQPPSESAAWAEFRKSYFNLPYIIYDLRLINAVMVMFVLFLHLKHLIPIVNSDIYDQQLLVLERLVLGGKLAFEWFRIFPGIDVAPTISMFYQWFYPYLSLVVLVFVMQRDRTLAQKFCCCFCLTWFVGVLVVYLYPTLGPCFFIPDIYSVLPHTHMTDMQADLWSMRQEILRNPAHPTAVYSISGLPSLHLAVVLLGTYYLWKLHKIAGFFSAVFCLLTVVSTLYFGWHYIWDNVASIFLVILTIWLTDRFVSALS